MTGHGKNRLVPTSHRNWTGKFPAFHPNRDIRGWFPVYRGKAQPVLELGELLHSVIHLSVYTVTTSPRAFIPFINPRKSYAISIQ